MGGTSTDVTLVRGGEAAATGSRSIGGSPVSLPMVDIHTIGAGGGSIAWIDAGGALRAGPESAGADPGPACYGLGGEQATVTDANLCLGYLGERLGGPDGLALDAERARGAVGEIAGRLGTGIEDAALAIRTIANAEMTQALRVISVERGHDPGAFTLAAFGGAGPMHAIDLAQELGIKSVMFPDSCGVLSALGMVVGDERRDWVRTVYSPDGWDERSLSSAFAALELDKAGETGGAELTRGADLRYRGQSHELTVPLIGAEAGGMGGGPEASGKDRAGEFDRKRLIAAFEAAHEQAYGFYNPGEPVELVNIRLTAIRKRSGSSLSQTQTRRAHPGESTAALTPAAAIIKQSPRRRAWFGGGWQMTPVLRREDMIVPEPEAPLTFAGPLIIEDDEATIVIPPGWQGQVDKSLNLIVTRMED